MKRLTVIGLVISLGHHDSFQLGLIYPSEGASTTPLLFGFLGLQKCPITLTPYTGRGRCSLGAHLHRR